MSRVTGFHSPPSGITLRTASREDDGPALAALLDDAFPEVFEGRTFYKQQPHSRVLAFEGERLIGQVGLDLRAVTIDGGLYEIAGIVDLCVAPAMRGRAVGSALLAAAEDVGAGRDFALLCADDQRLYRAHGYSAVTPAPTRWFAIDGLRSHSVIERDLGDCLMAKPLGPRAWPGGPIDLLGTLF